MSNSATVSRSLDSLKTTVQNHCPRLVFALVATVYYVCLPWKPTRCFVPREGCWLIIAPGERYYTTDRRHSDRGSQRRIRNKLNKYQLDGFVEVEPDDTVVDVGAYVGEFTVGAAPLSGEIIACEPDPKTYHCLQKTTEKIANVTTRNVAISDRQGQISFKKASDPTESSLINVDQGQYEEITVETGRLDDTLDRPSTVDFLKVDAEGGEPEVLRGCAGLSIRKVAVDAGPERFSESTAGTVEDILRERGYEIETRGSVIFAKLPG